MGLITPSVALKTNIKINFMKKLLILLLSAFSLTTFAQEKQVAILEPIAITKEVSSMHRSMVRGEMVKAIGRQSGYAAFTRTDIDQIMAEQNFQQSGMVDDATRKRIGEMHGRNLFGHGYRFKNSHLLLLRKSSEWKRWE